MEDAATSPIRQKAGKSGFQEHRTGLGFQRYRQVWPDAPFFSVSSEIDTIILDTVNNTSLSFIAMHYHGHHFPLFWSASGSDVGMKGKPWRDTFSSAQTDPPKIAFVG